MAPFWGRWAKRTNGAERTDLEDTYSSPSRYSQCGHFIRQAPNSSSPTNCPNVLNYFYLGQILNDPKVVIFSCRIIQEDSKSSCAHINSNTYRVSTHILTQNFGKLGHFRYLKMQFTSPLFGRPHDSGWWADLILHFASFSVRRPATLVCCLVAPVYPQKRFLLSGKFVDERGQNGSSLSFHFGIYNAAYVYQTENQKRGSFG